MVGIEFEQGKGHEVSANHSFPMFTIDYVGRTEHIYNTYITYLHIHTWLKIEVCYLSKGWVYVICM